MTHPVNGDLECWQAPQSPFQILYSRLVLEQIRLAVVDAYYLVPRGGVEIGGVLLGKYHDRQVEIIDDEPFECEHAFGPSFSLSPRDEECLKDVLAKVRNKSSGLEPVGWYHSHTRSEIFLTEADLKIHDRYFPEMWQVALVVRPSTSQPARAGFFFREIGGSIHASASHHEFQLEPLRGRPALPKKEAYARDRLSNGNPKAADSLTLPALESEPQPMIGSNPQAPSVSPAAPTANPPPPLGRALTPAAIANPLLELGRLTAADPQPKLERWVTPVADVAGLPKQPAATTPEPQPAPEASAVSTLVRRVDSGSQLIELPRFLGKEAPPQAGWSRVPVFVIGMVCLAVAVGGLVFVVRDSVSPLISGLAGRVSPSCGRAPRIGPAMTIKAINGQEFQIRWDTGSPAIQDARSAVLAIVDGGVAQRIPLDGSQLQAGAFNFRKHSARVDFRLTIVTAKGSSVEAATIFLGPLSVPEGEPAPANAGAATLATQNAQPRRQVDGQVARNKTLHVQLDQLRQEHAKDTVP
jgi:proteasome lid subunit RPN8/RPN11